MRGQKLFGMGEEQKSRMGREGRREQKIEWERIRRI
jgi:hypothetical protein